MYADMHGVIARPAAEKTMPAALFVMLVAMLIAGRLADRFGAFTVFRIRYLLLTIGTGPLLVVVCLACFGLVLVQANVIFSQPFPTSIRVIGYSIPYTISAAIFGGTTPAVAQSFAASDRPLGIIWYASATAIMSAPATLLIRRSDIKVRG